jgi:hypothetical protein
MQYLDACLVKEVVKYFDVIVIHCNFHIRLRELHLVMIKINKYYSYIIRIKTYYKFILK